MSVVSLLHCVSAGLASETIWDAAIKLISPGSDCGPMWPLYLEWRANKWKGYRKLPRASEDETVLDMASYGIRVFNPKGLPRVFDGVAPDDFPEVDSAIEESPGGYDGEES
jgi:hypothetical protein